MDISQVIANLRKASAGSRELDAQIAIVTGWKRTPTEWLSPTSEPSRVPKYSTNMQSAFELLQGVGYTGKIGASWEDGKGSAALGSSIIEAESPMLALCIGALAVHKMTKDKA